MQYKMKVYSDGSKKGRGEGSGVAIFADGSLTHQLRYKLVEKCSNNEAEQHAIVKALKKLRKMQTTQRSHRTAPNHTDSRITLEAIANPRKYQSLVESIRKEIRILFSGMGAATIFGAKQVQDIYTIFDFFSLYYML